MYFDQSSICLSWIGERVSPASCRSAGGSAASGCSLACAFAWSLWRCSCERASCSPACAARRLVFASSLARWPGGTALASVSPCFSVSVACVLAWLARCVKSLLAPCMSWRAPFAPRRAPPRMAGIWAR